MKNHSLKDKVALVSGSSMGIGKAIAMELVLRGAKVVLNGREEDRLGTAHEEFSKMGYEVKAFVADVRIPDQCAYLIQETIRSFGQLDILVNNAGISSRGSVEDMATSNFIMLMETNFNGSAYLSKYALDHLKKTRGNVVFINSAGGFRGMPYNSAYTASKLAQAALVDALRIEWYDYGIHVGIAHVGFTVNDPEKKILDVDGSWIYLPQRTNVNLASPQSVANSVCDMIIKRKKRITLTSLGVLANLIIRYLPILTEWIVWTNRKKIKEEFTLIGGEKVYEKTSSSLLPKEDRN
ncbi:SDR family NAD(P)-dependent oxidoreductase [Arenibacter sp. F26102]|uniref:SDR family NAD(P)-dependent oxidoreductase n=1 Tax=Arenibacter sp. F26102 TaxID=2926416 RepID=UPI001FF4A02D|nr:SDR family NAD(P)-dependent oxidoreductase [Arenibacter sp. F26102]MCK0147095.1 SDR family NAD(P)-dependent oxidoreductase [Arenibacter sp. F26102]